MYSKTLIILAGILQLSVSCPPFLNDYKSVNIKQGRADVNYRLPLHIAPVFYTITLEPHLDTGSDPTTFNGSVILDFKTLNEATNITLHARQLNIDSNSISVTDIDENNVSISGISYDEETEFYTIFFTEILPADMSYTLSIKSFWGYLRTDNDGFYLAKYTDESGIERRMATTQFESTGARKAFPCLDEPALKAKFVINLIRTANYTSISNEVPSVIGADLGGGRYQDSYQTSVIMSPYLVAFVISAFDYIQKDSYRVYARPLAIKNGWADYALQTGIDVIDFNSEYFAIPYSLRKMDQIGIPDNYFAPGAMENWGLVTYRETYILYENGTSTTDELNSVTTIIGHEFAHQWFGNLVTLNWWRYLWLNEGFATYYQYFTSQKIRPDWRMMDQFQLNAFQYAFGPDSLNTTQPMNYETSYPGGGAPSYISYQKASAVIHMMGNFLTQETLQKGLGYYLTENQYSSAIPEYLYNSLEKALFVNGGTALLGGLSLLDIMTTWTEQKGYPVVKAEMNYSNGQITLNQEKFLLESTVPDEPNKWMIPINIAFSSLELNFDNTAADIWMTNSTTILNDAYPTTGFFILNKQQTGYYRVNYDDINWNRIIDFLLSENYNQIHLLNRAQLIDDSFNLARSGRLSYTIPITLSKYLERELDFVPISSFITALGYINKMLLSHENYGVLKTHIINILTPALDNIGYTESYLDQNTDMLNRIKLISTLCDMGSDICRQNTKIVFNAWMSDPTKTIPPNLQSPVYCGAMRSGTQAEWDFLYEEYNKNPISFIRSRSLRALGCSEDINVLNNFMTLIMTTSNSKLASERTSAFQGIYRSGPIGLNAAFDFIGENFLELVNILSMEYILGDLANYLSTQSQLDKLNQLAGSYAEYSYMFTNAISRTQQNIVWNENYADIIFSAITSN